MGNHGTQNVKPINGDQFLYMHTELHGVSYKSWNIPK